ncbi:MAG: PEP-CTERM sorting domain-containing protein, partial [Planctomycetota bacterium]
PPELIVEPGWGTYYEVETLVIPYPVQPGIQHTVDYSSSQAGAAVIGLFLGGTSEYSWDGDEIDRIDITVVPEPMTVSLLALGGALVLIRKHKTQSHY